MSTQVLLASQDADVVGTVQTLLAEIGGVHLFETLDSAEEVLGTLATAEMPVEVVLIHENLGSTPVLDLVREIGIRNPGVGVVLLVRQGTPQIFSAAMEAGCRGILTLPLSLEELEHRVNSAAAWSRTVRRHLTGESDSSFGGQHGTVVAVTGAKGGVGTTLVALQLALSALAPDRSVCLVDLDLQGGDVASYLDVQFRRSFADLVDVADDITGRVLQESVYTHDTGLRLLLAPTEGERAEEVGSRAARQIVSALRSRFDVVVIDAGTTMNEANTTAIEMADQVLLLTTPDVVGLRSAKRMVRLWQRLQIRKDEELALLVNRVSRHTEIQPDLVQRLVGVPMVRTSIPAAFREIEATLNSGRLHELAPGTFTQAIRRLAAETGILPTGGHAHAGETRHSGKRWRRAGGDDGSAAVEFAGLFPVLLVIGVLLWQVILTGYTFMLAGHAAAEGARRLAVVGTSDWYDVENTARDDLPAAWRDSASMSYGSPEPGTGVEHVSVRLNVPAGFPGFFDLPLSFTGRAGTLDEES